MRFKIDPDYKGDCHCGKRATKTWWFAFDKPIPAVYLHGVMICAEATGIWNSTCEAHVPENARIKED